MSPAAWSAGRWLALLAGSFFVSAYVGLSVFFRLGAPEYQHLGERLLGDMALLLSGVVAVGWLLVLVGTFVPRIRAGALVILAIALLAAMFVPPALLLI